MILDKLYSVLTLYDEDQYEYQIAAYLLSHKRDIDHIKLVDVIKETHISKSTIRRFCKKIGYQSYSEIQYLMHVERPTHISSFEGATLDFQYESLFKGKKRLVILGDICSLSPLMTYRAYFDDLGIDFCLVMDLEDSIDELESFVFQPDDLIIQVSLYHSPIELMTQFFSSFSVIESHARKCQVDYLYIGRISSSAIPHHYYAIEATPVPSQSILALCAFFESIYDFYSKGS